MTDVSQQLNSSGTNQPQRNLLSKANAQFLKAGVEYEAQRLKFGFGKPKRDDLLKEINGYNDRLEKLLVANDRVAALSEPKGTFSFAPDLYSHIADTVVRGRTGEVK